MISHLPFALRSGDLPSQLKFENLHFSDWTGTAITNTSVYYDLLSAHSRRELSPFLVVNLQCSPAVGCGAITFDDFKVSPPAGQGSRFICVNTTVVSGLPGLL